MISSHAPEQPKPELSSYLESEKKTSRLWPRLMAHLSTLTGPFRYSTPQTLAPQKVSFEYSQRASPTRSTIYSDQASPAHQGRIVAHYYHSPREDDVIAPLLVLIPGLGGSAFSPYMGWVAHRAGQLGYATLALSHRGSGDSSPGYYHAGWYQDALHCVEHPSLVHHTRRLLAGFSLGGHIAGRLACAADARGVYQSIFACGAPLDLKATQLHLDHHALPIYKRYLLANIKRVAHGLLLASARNELILSEEQREGLALSLNAKTIAEFDRYAIAKLLGYSSEEAYYEGESLTSYLSELHTSLTWAMNQYDPFITYSQLLQLPSHILTNPLFCSSLYQRGGHIYGHASGESALPSAMNALFIWLRSRYE